MSYQERIGTYFKCSVGGEVYHTYVPKPLPPKPALQMDHFYPLIDQANTAIGRLDGISMVLPDPSLFLYVYIRKEAILSSQIEGTQSSLSDLLLFENKEAPGVPLDDVTEVSNYVAAMEYGLKRIEEGFPLSLRLIREIHEVLLAKGRGHSKQPGEFRQSQNWIGGTRPGNARFVPPPPEKIMECLGDLEKFLNDETHRLPVLVKAALVHVQFETIHPFLDGNGRLGRLLITFILCADKMMKEPLLYLSLYFKTNRQLYYDHLQLVRETGNWEEWVQFFLKGVIDTANQAVEMAQTILQLFSKDQQKINEAGKPLSSTLVVYHHLQKTPIADTPRIKEKCKLTLPTIIKALNQLENLGIVKEITGKARNKIYVYKEYLDILNKGTEPLDE